MNSSMYLEELAQIILRDLTYCGLVFKGIFPDICKVLGSSTSLGKSNVER